MLKTRPRYWQTGCMVTWGDSWALNSYLHWLRISSKCIGFQLPIMKLNFLLMWKPQNNGPKAATYKKKRITYVDWVPEEVRERFPDAGCIYKFIRNIIYQIDRCFSEYNTENFLMYSCRWPHLSDTGVQIRLLVEFGWFLHVVHLVGQRIWVVMQGATCVWNRNSSMILSHDH